MVAHPFASLYIGVVTGGLFGFLQCISTGIVLETPWNAMSAGEMGIFKASLLIGAALGAMSGGFISDSIGPRKALGISGLIAFLCAGGLEAQSKLWIFIILRIVSGLSVGSTASIGPLYVSENSDPKYRGVFGTVYQLAICIGILLSYVVNYAFVFMPDGSEAWRWELLTTGFFPFLLMIGYFFIPESSGYEEKMNRKSSSMYANINTDDEGESERRKGSIIDNFKEVLISATSNKRAFIVGIMMAVFQQITGINVLMLYGPDLIKAVSDSFSGNKVTLIIQIIIGAWNLLSTIAAVGLVDVLGRRPLLIAGLVLMLIGNLLFGLSQLIKALGAKSYVLAFPGMALFIFGFEMGIGPLFFLLTSELYAVEVRGRAMGIMGMINWISNILVVLLFPIIADAVHGQGWIFIVLTAFCLIMIIFSIPVVPETKGKALTSDAEREPML